MIYLFVQKNNEVLVSDPPEVPEDDIQKALGAIGVKYSHRNDDVLLPSRIEEERSRNALKVHITWQSSFGTLNLLQEHKRRRASGRKSKDAEAETKTKRPKTPEMVWPPKRKHHKPPPTPTEQ